MLLYLFSCSILLLYSAYCELSRLQGFITSHDWQLWSWGWRQCEFLTVPVSGLGRCSELMLIQSLASLQSTQSNGHIFQLQLWFCANVCEGGTQLSKYWQGESKRKCSAYRWVCMLCVWVLRSEGDARKYMEKRVKRMCWRGKRWGVRYTYGGFQKDVERKRAYMSNIECRGKWCEGKNGSDWDTLKTTTPSTELSNV